MSVLEKALEMRARAHEIHASNIANANVPNFKARTISFENRLQDALEGLENSEAPLIERENTVATKLGSVNPEVIEDPLATANGDGNTVSLEKEQVSLAKNTIAYEATIEMMARKFALAKYVLGEGGR